MKKKFFWDQTKLANRHWLAANMPPGKVTLQAKVGDTVVGSTTFFAYAGEAVSIGNIYVDDNEINLPFLKKKFAYYKIPAVKQLEGLLKRINFVNFDRARKHIDEILFTKQYNKQNPKAKTGNRVTNIDNNV